MTHATPTPLVAPIQSTNTVAPVTLAATVAVGLAAVLGLVVIVRVARRYRSDRDPSLRALAVGISLVAAVPLVFLFLDVGLLPDRIRYLAVSLLQGAGLLAILRGMYGPAGRRRRWAERSIADLIAAAIALGTGTTVGAATILLGDSSPLAATGIAVVVAGGTFVAEQAARAYKRRGDPRMLALAAGTVALVVAPTPVALTLLDRGSEAAALGYAGFFVLGQVLLLVTLSGRGR